MANYTERKKSYSFSKFYYSPLFKLTVSVKMLQFHSHRIILSNTQEYDAVGKLPHF